ncbi:hypothetical protein [Azospirillum sp. sgz302134]
MLTAANGQPLVLWTPLLDAIGVSGVVYRKDAAPDGAHLYRAVAPDDRPIEENHDAIDDGRWCDSTAQDLRADVEMREAVRLILAGLRDALGPDAAAAADRDMASFPPLPETWRPDPLTALQLGRALRDPPEEAEAAPYPWGG